MVCDQLALALALALALSLDLALELELELFWCFLLFAVSNPILSLLAACQGALRRQRKLHGRPGSDWG